MNNASQMPAKHSGQLYADFLATLVKKRECQRYLEVGVSNGFLMNRIACETAIGVDPAFDLKFDVTANKKNVYLHKMTSDRYFTEVFTESDFDRIDFAFLDGMHTFEFLLRDFYNTEKICTAEALIGMHDCLPPNEEMTERDFGRAAERGKNTPFPSHWTGDVWKIIPILQKYRPDLRLVFVDAPPTGVVFVTNLDPNSEVIKHNYVDIVKEFEVLRSDCAELSKMYSGIEIIGTDRILNGFDHTLFFRI